MKYPLGSAQEDIAVQPEFELLSFIQSDVPTRQEACSGS